MDWQQAYSIFQDTRDALERLAFKAGWKYAEQENGALAGMAEQPSLPEDGGNGFFWAGYEAWREQQDTQP